MRPLYWRSPPLHLESAASLVRQKSSEQTTQSERVPAAPPEAMLAVSFSVYEASFGVANMALILSLKAKFNAWVGKYRMQLAKFPRQKAPKPSSFMVRLVQSTIPP